MPLIELLFLASLASYRMTRFIISDSLFDGTRQRFQDSLVIRNKLWADKVYELSTCPYCVSPYISAAVIAVVDAFISIPLPVFVWLATCGGTMVTWRYVEHPIEKDE